MIGRARNAKPGPPLAKAERPGGSRIRNDTSSTIATPEPEADFAALYLARRYRPRPAAGASRRGAGEPREGFRMKDASRLRRDQSSGAGGLPCRSEPPFAGRQDHRARACRAQSAPRGSQPRIVQGQPLQRPMVRLRHRRQGRRSGFACRLSRGRFAGRGGAVAGANAWAGNRRAPQWMTPPINSRL